MKLVMSIKRTMLLVPMMDGPNSLLVRKTLHSAPKVKLGVQAETLSPRKVTSMRLLLQPAGVRIAAAEAGFRSEATIKRYGP